MKVKNLIVGLGNPGDKYAKTRHNVGFMVLDSICQEFKSEKKFNAELCDSFHCHPRESGNPDSGQARITNNAAILMKPQTFMNLSGKAVRSLVDYYKIEAKNIWVIYDDVDISFGEMRVREGGSSAGHKGIESIINHLGTQNFLRFRIGIRNELVEKVETENFVLQNFNSNEKERLPEIIDLCTKEIKEILDGKDIEPKTIKVK